MRRALAGSAALLCLAALSPARAQLPPDLLGKLKAATVFVKVQAGPLRGSGSGFVFSVDGKAALIATNEHVVVAPFRAGQPAVVDVVFDSGRQTERTARATVVALDAERDLAVLRVADVADLPAPLAFQKRPDLHETMGVYILGYPFGDRLTEGKNPAVTIGKGSVSSLREDGQGRLKAVQVDGDVNPGNSGGPVVDEKGNLVGVAVAAVRGTRIGLAVPTAELTRLLGGRVGDVTLAVVKAADGVADVAVEVALLDPLNKIKGVSVLVAGADAAKGMKPGPDGSFPPLPGGKEFPLKVDGQKATGVVQVPSGGRSVEKVAVQPAFVNADKETVRAAPASPFAVDFVKAAPVAIPAGIEGAGEAGPVGDLLVASRQIGEGAAKNTMCWAADAKSFYHLDGAGTLRRVSFPGLEVEATRATGKRCSRVTVSSRGPILTHEEGGEAWLLDGKTLDVVQTYRTGKALYLASSPGSAYAYGVESTPSEAVLTVYDLKDGKAVNRYSHRDFEARDVRAVHFVSPAVSPDGRYLFTMGGFGRAMYRFRLEGPDVVCEEAAHSLLSGEFLGAALSHDGKYFSAPSRDGNPPVGGDAPARHRTYVFLAARWERPVLALRFGGPSLAVGFDLASGLIYAHDPDHTLIVHDARGARLKAAKLAPTDRPGTVRQILVHPEGRKVVVLVDGEPGATTVHAVTLPAR